VLPRPVSPSDCRLSGNSHRTADGKQRRLEEILATRANRESGQEVFAIGGFGNSYNTDGPFLAWIARQALPAGSPVVVMINGGSAPPEYAGLFTELESRAHAASPQP